MRIPPFCTKIYLDIFQSFISPSLLYTIERERKKNSNVTYIIKKAIQFIESEQRLLEKRVTNPELFISYSHKKDKSTLYWKKSKTELAEILLALELDGAICKSNGDKADFTEVVRTFQWLFNIRLGEAYDLKRAVATRKTKLTIYLDKLKELLKDYHLKI